MGVLDIPCFPSEGPCSTIILPALCPGRPTFLWLLVGFSQTGTVEGGWCGRDPLHKAGASATAGSASLGVLVTSDLEESELPAVASLGVLSHGGPPLKPAPCVINSPFRELFPFCRLFLARTLTGAVGTQYVHD